MHINSNVIAGVLPLTPKGTNSTMFTECCETAICNYERRCPHCRRLIIGYDAETDSERDRIRWEYATRHWVRRSHD